MFRNEKYFKIFFSPKRDRGRWEFCIGREKIGKRISIIRALKHVPPSGVRRSHLASADPAK
jgi:hypothetical protein